VTWQATVGGIASIIAAGIMVATLLMVWPRRNAVGGRPLTGLLIAMLWWTVTTGLEQMVVGINPKVTLSALSYPGAVSVSVFFFLFCVEYTQSDSWLPRPRWLLWVIPVFSVLAAFTNGWHHNLWTGFEPQPGNTMLYDHGPLFWLMIGYSYLLIMAGVIVVILAFGRHDRAYRGQFGSVLVFASFPIVGSVLYVAGLSPVPGMDPTPIVFAITAVGLTWALLRQGLLSVIPIAQETVLHNLHDAVVVLDSANRVAMVNRSFMEWLGLGGSLIGKPATEVLRAWPPLLRAVNGEIDDQEMLIDHPVQRYVDLRRAVVSDDRGRVRGMVLVLRDINDLRLSEMELREANTKLTTQLSTIQTLQEGLREQALRDPLTGLYNRRYLEETVGRELARAQRNHEPLTVLMIDLDHFKNLNDEFGHAAGDQVLRWFGDLVRTKLRPGDIACRYGGEEFMLIMPSAPLTGGITRGDEIRTAFTHLVMTASNNRYSGVTLSAGVATFPDDARTASELRRKADAALYVAKRTGRNRVVAYSEQIANPATNLS
jgi:diguanylate cyclase (GGDEF)-like protein